MATPFTVLFLAGGRGTRMGHATPKQFIPLQGKPLALYSFECLMAVPGVEGCVVVCASEFRSLFTHPQKRILFAEPGERRQDSVWSGLQLVMHRPASSLICIHDAARPFINSALVERAVSVASCCGAAAVGTKAKQTIKVCDEDNTVISTPPREYLWEVQTPQVVRLDWLQQGFVAARAGEVTVTDDLSLIELLGLKPKIVEGSPANIKVTTPEDWVLAEQLIIYAIALSDALKQ